MHDENYKQIASNCIKVVLFGPESTGKTMLSQQLAAHYNTLWVPEFSRLYAEEKAKNNQVLSEKDVLTIAKGQMQLENELARQVDDLLICDTDLLETKVYAEAYYSGACHPILEKYALENTYDLYFLTYIDIPWEADGIRDKPHERAAMFKAFEQELIKQKKPYVLLKGDKKQRFKTAVAHIDKLLKNKK